MTIKEMQEFACICVLFHCLPKENVIDFPKRHPMPKKKGGYPPMNTKKYGLVLSGGGGKGAYQVGAFKALHELGIDASIRGISGSSVGALNAVLLLNGNYRTAEETWVSIKPIHFLNMEPDGYCSRDDLLRLTDERIDLNKVSRSPVPAYITVTKSDPPESSKIPAQIGSAVNSLREDRYEREGEHLLINGRSPEYIKNVLLASTSIPLVYAPVEIDGSWYRDGGLYDAVPIRPLIETGLTDLIIVKCSPNQQVDPYLLSRADSVIEISPSSDIGSLFSGTLDFDGKNAMFRLQLGYYDTLRTFEYAKRKAEGFPPSEEEKRQRIAQDRERAQSLSRVSEHVQDIDRNRSKIDSIMKKYGL